MRRDGDVKEEVDGLVQVMVPLAVSGLYTYLCGDIADLGTGDIVEVSFGSRHVLGVVRGHCESCGIETARLKPVLRRVMKDGIPLDLLNFIDWVGSYNCAPAGLFLRSVLGGTSVFEPRAGETCVVYKGGALKRLTPARQRVLDFLQDGEIRGRSDLARSAGVSLGVIDGLVALGILETVKRESADIFERPDPDYSVPVLNEDQEKAVNNLRAGVASRKFSVTLLEGVTGSGKTEVYFEAISQALKQGRQSLVLLPEIALTGQFLDRFRKRFGVCPAEWHSGLGGAYRSRVWHAVREGKASVVIGARSGLYLPFSDLGLIVVDEEHDSGYKQEEPVAYHARDMAVKRGHLGDFPVILSSATPSIETYVNVRSGRYGKLALPVRFGARSMPRTETIDLRAYPALKGQFLSAPLISAIGETIGSGAQALVFLNRRGYAPLTLCGACGERFTCPDCSAWLVEHRSRGVLTCHYCGFRRPVPLSCPDCSAMDRFVSCGPGVERISAELEALFPDIDRVILSSDFTVDIPESRELLQDIAEGRYHLIIGTQLIAKGHHFPRLALVGVVDGDLGLGYADLRASEKTFQLLHQVVGRAGRGDFAGRGLIQTHMPEHPVMKALVSGTEENFYEVEALLRQKAGLPPFGCLAALIFSGSDKAKTEKIARTVALSSSGKGAVHILGPAEAPLALIRGRYRFRILIKAERRADLQECLSHLASSFGVLPGGVRLRIDIDPQNFL